MPPDTVRTHACTCVLQSSHDTDLIQFRMMHTICVTVFFDTVRVQVRTIDIFVTMSPDTAKTQVKAIDSMHICVTTFSWHRYNSS